ncbi:MAG: response regulator [Gammaproteobacteria bacterium]
MTKATILLADDDKVTLSILGAGLQRDGYRVLTAMDGLQAIMVAHRTKPDAIVLDIMMPAGNGLNVLQKLKASSATQQIPIIAMSSSQDPALPAQVLAGGGEFFLPKPVHFTDLRSLLGRLLGALPKVDPTLP